MTDSAIKAKFSHNISNLKQLLTYIRNTSADLCVFFSARVLTNPILISPHSKFSIKESLCLGHERPCLTLLFSH